MTLMKEVYIFFDINIVFEDDQSCFDVAESNKLLPRTKNTAV